MTTQPVAAGESAAANVAAQRQRTFAPVMLTVDAVNNSIVLDRCTGLMPATFGDVAAGAHTLALTASTLSKGSVSGTNENQLPSFDDYVIVHLPLAAGDDASRRFFMLNGVGATDGVHAVGRRRGQAHVHRLGRRLQQRAGHRDARRDRAEHDRRRASPTCWRGSTACASTPATVTVSDTPASRDARRQHAVSGRRFEGRFRAAAPAQREAHGSVSLRHPQRCRGQRRFHALPGRRACAPGSSPPRSARAARRRSS